MFRQIYLYDGTPYVPYKDENGEYVYPNEAWTEIAPPDGIYKPFYFNGEEWVGTSKEDWESEQPPKDPYQPEPSMIQMSQTQLQVAEGSSQLRDSQKKLAQTMLDNAEKDRRVTKLEDQVAEIMLELSEKKGEN